MKLWCSENPVSTCMYCSTLLEDFVLRMLTHAVHGVQDVTPAMTVTPLKGSLANAEQWHVNDLLGIINGVDG